MNLLINFYDNFLIYNPNVFFSVLFLIVILGLILLGKIIILLYKNFVEINNRVGKRKFSLDLPSQKFFKFILLLAVNLFILIDKALIYIQFYIEKIIKIIKKEIFIEE